MSVDNLVNKALKRIGAVHPVIKQGAEEIIRRAYKQGIYVLFSDGYRSHAEQNALYAQGRTKPGNIVTNAKGGQSLHNYGLALDMFITNKEGTTATWPTNKLREVAQIAKSLGFEWGGDWTSFKDYPHIQMTGGLTLSQLQTGQKPNIKLKNVSQSTSSTSNKTNSKSIAKMAQEVIDGKHGNGHEARRKSLGISKAEYEKVRKEVNAITSGKKKKPTTTKTVQQMANEVKKGLHGNGHETRRKSLGISKSEYEKVRKLVNAGIHPSSSKSVSQMAKEVIAGKHGRGHENRRKSLGIDNATYQKVRAEVNKRA